MTTFKKKEVTQAILIADNADKLQPFVNTEAIALLPLVNVPMLDYALEALSRSEIDEVFIFCKVHLQTIRDYIKQCQASLRSWTLKMRIELIGGEGCRSFGDAMRELDSSGLIRGNFILLGADTLTNVNLRQILEEHKKTVNYDRGIAATILLKDSGWQVRSGNELMIAIDILNKRLHYYHRLSINQKEREFNIPLEVFLTNTEIALLHNVGDPQITIGTPAMLSLFSDNFDFESRDDFIRGLLINEDILDCRIYVSFIQREQYACKVNSWLAYQLASNDIINRRAYPLVPDMGVTSLTQHYIFLKNNIYRSPSASLMKVSLKENVVVDMGCLISIGTSLSNSVLGQNVKIGENCRLNYSFIFDNVVVNNNCILEYCVIGSNTKIGSDCEIGEGTIIGRNCVIPSYTKFTKATVICSTNPVSDDLKTNYVQKELNDDDDDDLLLSNDSVSTKIMQLPIFDEDSDYTSSSEDNESIDCTPLPDDTNIFLSEVIDSLTRGFQEKTNPDFLILEINSSRYAYNMSLKEVNVNVVKALFNLPTLKDESSNILGALNIILKQLGPVVSNYIRDEDAMQDCLKGLEDIFEENPLVRSKFSQIIYHLYDKDFLSEDAILKWHMNLDHQADDSNLKKNLQKLIEFLEQSSDESSGDK